MYQIGNYVVHPQAGVCRIDRIQKMAPQLGCAAASYYCLVPVSDPSSCIYVRADLPTPQLRDPLTLEQADTLLRTLPSLPLLHGLEGKEREQQYRRIIKSGSCLEQLELYKTLLCKQQTRNAQKKPPSTIEQRYLRDLKGKILGELSFVLHESKASVEQTLMDHLYG